MADSKKYDGSQWEHSLRKLTTATEAVENPLYSDGTAITNYTIKGNTVQSGTPTPSNPVPVVGVGELETTGEHSGEYKIPISSANTTTPVYLGEVESTRKIKKYEMTGNEDITYQSAYSRFFFIRADAYYTGTVRTTPCICSHYQSIHDGRALDDIPNESIYIATADNKTAFNIKTTDFTDATDFKSYLAQQYANGTPVTVWYVLATPTTGIVNEPLMKIGDYTDTLSNATTIPTTEGANSITVDTTVQPSEFTATWTGWHDASVKEWDGSQWNE